MNFTRVVFSFLPGKRLISIAAIQRQKTLKDIPGAPTLPFVGTLLDLLWHKNGLSKALIHLQKERVEQYGKVYREIFGPEYLVCIANPDDAEIIFRNESSYPKRFESPLFEYFWKKYAKDPGVFFLNGVEWYKYRSILSKQMLIPRSISHYTPAMNRISSELVTRLKTLRVPEGFDTSLEVPDIDQQLFRWSFESVAFAVFEKHFGLIQAASVVDPNVNEFIAATSDFLKVVVPTAYIPPKLFDYYHTKGFKIFASSYNKMYELAQLFILERLREFEDSKEELYVDTDSEVGLLRYLLFSKDLSERELLCSIVDLLFAGVDTTSSTVQWVLYELAKNPDKQASLFDEITATLPSSQITPTHCYVSYTDLKHLPFLKAVVKETLRLHPVLALLTRVLQKDTVISKYKLPATTSVHIMSYVMGRDPDLFDEPEQFLPERWLKSSTFHKFSSLPFGFGKRMCLGKRLAELEIHILVFHILANFFLQYPENETMETIVRGTLTPEKPVRVKFFERKHPQEDK